jgi:hypothetical protein
MSELLESLARLKDDFSREVLVMPLLWLVPGKDE